METAKKHYLADADAARTALQSIKRIDSPDGFHEFKRANAAEMASLKEYIRVMKICSDLVIRGKQPPAE